MPSPSKFEGIDFAQIPVERITPDILKLGQGFRCLRGEFVTYWKQGRIQREADAHICHCWAIRSGDSLAGYITLLAEILPPEIPYRTMYYDLKPVIELLNPQSPEA
jgi:hypothetical protein